MARILPATALLVLILVGPARADDERAARLAELDGQRNFLCTRCAGTARDATVRYR